MKDGFIKLAAATPHVHIGSAEKNADEIIRIVHLAAKDGVKAVAFPELSLTGVTCGALFYTETLLNDAESALLRVARECEELDILSFVGLPIRFGGSIFDCTAVIKGGRILALVPRVLPFIGAGEPNCFATDDLNGRCVRIGEDDVPIGDKIMLRAANCDSAVFACVTGRALAASRDIIGELCRAGADVIFELSGGAELVGRDEYTRAASCAASGRHNCAVISASAGDGESTTDYIFSGHSIISNNGSIVAERLPFADTELTSCVIDTSHLAFDRRKNKLVQCADGFKTIDVTFDDTETCIDGVIDPSPFIPHDSEKRRERCALILEMQSRALARRLEAAHAKSAVIGISGGLDSCLSLLVSVRAMKYLERPVDDITAVTMPCFGTTARTKGNAEKLCEILGCSFRTVDIADAVNLHFRDIGHDPLSHNVVYENAQARERTQIIMDIANADGGIVVGTGDLSELALGWATYNGDHMSNYGTNAGIPKTLIRHVVAHCADTAELEGDLPLAEVLRDILATPVSPELLPPKEGEIAQKTEDLVGPYELHDFFLYRFVRYGESPEKLRRTALAAFAGVYSDEIITGWLRVFIRRFFTQQFKRSALPDGVKIGSVGLSPRGDFNMPSDVAPWKLDF